MTGLEILNLIVQAYTLYASLELILMLKYNIGFYKHCKESDIRYRPCITRLTGINACWLTTLTAHSLI